ncbi:MAG TPA: alpha/beta hydrolase [Acidimicrobiales bacterium]|nr:alpha/beta hydrolase [Acidimicrobiales bacterium]
MEPTARRVTANDVEFGVLELGPDDGPLALCLHGFPDSAHTWRLLLPELAERGWHAVAPFMRGYAPTAVPADGRYQSGALVADACALHDVLGGDGRAVVIGHDWGASAAYGAAAYEPDRWNRVVAAAVPPSGALGMGFLDFDQLRRSWYMFFFQNPLADVAVSMNDLAFIGRLWEDWSPGYDGAADVENVKDCLRDPAHLAAALGYYRALFDPSKHVPELAEQQAATGAVPPQPTLYLHGRSDGCLGVGLTSRAGEFLSAGSRVEVVDDAGHFLHVEQPAVVNGLITDFIGQPG